MNAKTMQTTRQIIVSLTAQAVDSPGEFYQQMVEKALTAAKYTDSHGEAGAIYAALAQAAAMMRLVETMENRP